MIIHRCVWLVAVSMVVAEGPVRAGGATMPLFADGKPLLPVFIAADAAPGERQAADELGRVLGKISGLDWPVRVASSAGGSGFYLGHWTQPAAMEPLKIAKDFLLPEKDEVGPDGFRIESRGGSVFIEGATPVATGFAVAWLLQREGGVRWYAPGPGGEIIPKKSQWSLPEMHAVRSPAYVSREISGLWSADEKQWAQRNGLAAGLEFSHGLNRIFTPEILAAHPDWAPLLQEGRVVTKASDEGTWQPNLALPELARFAAERAQTVFESESGRKSFSLGMNDTIRFDQSAATRALVEPLRYFRGMPDYSPLVFGFMNRAADSLDRSDRYLGCLAYFWCENTPPFPVRTNVLPYVTTDRGQYFDRDYRAEDLALMERWGRSGVRAFGLWEYAYGRGFVIPRMPCRALADSIREGWHRGARGYLAEVEPQWGFDTFKTWMLTQLLWDPDRSYEELADDFFSGYYREAAAPMRRFFDRCEEQWMTQQGSPRWLKYYQQEDQALLFDETVCAELNQLLEQAVRLLPENSAERIRVTQTKRAFAVTDAYIQFDAVRRELAGTTAENLPLLAELSEKIGRLVHSRNDLFAKIKIADDGRSPAMTNWSPEGLVRNDPVPRVLWLAGVRDASEPDRIVRAIALTENDSKHWRVLADMISRRTLRAAPNLAMNSAFLKIEGKPFEPQFLHPRFGKIPAKWSIRAIPTQNGRLAVVDDFSRLDRKAVRIEGARDTQMYQWISVEPDCAYSAFAILRGKSSPGCDAALFLTFLDQAGNLIGHPEMQSLPKGLSENWRIAVLSDMAPESARWVGIGIGVTGQSDDDWLEVSDVELKGCVVGSLQ